MEAINNKFRVFLGGQIAHTETKVKQYFRTTSLSIFLTITLSLLLVIVAEILTITVGVLAGAITDGIVLVGLVNYTYFVQIPESRRIILPLTLVPLLRILSITIPVPHISPIIWYLLIGIPLLMAALVIIYINGLPALRFTISRRNWVVQGLFGLVGIPIGILAWRILPNSIINLPNRSIGWILMGAIILSLFSALPDEIIFRGMIQNSLTAAFGPIGLAITAVLYSVMFAGTLHWSYVVFFGLTGLLFSLWVKRTKSLWGVIIAHSIVNAIFIILLIH